MLAKLSLMQRGMIILGIPLLMQLFFLAVFAGMQQRIRKAEAESFHSKDVLLEARGVRVNVLRLDNATLRFAVTREAAAEAAYQEAAADLPKTVTHLKTLVQDNPEQLADAIGLEKRIQGFMAWHDQTMGALRRGAESEWKTRIADHAARAMLDDIRGNIDAFIGIERALDQNRAARLQTWLTAVRRLIFACMLVVLLSAPLLGLIFHWGVRRQLAALMENVARFGRGEPLAPPATGRDEISHVDRAFHEMADAVAHANDELRRSLDEVRDLYDNAPCGYHSLGPDGTILAINQTELNWLGVRRDDVVGKRKFSDYLTGHGQERFQKALARVKETDAVSNLEYDLIGADGAPIPVLVNAIAIRDADGQFVASRTTVFNIAEQRHAQEALRQSEQRFRLLVENVADYSIILLDAQGHVASWNRGAERITGYRADEILGQPFSVFHPSSSVDSDELEAAQRDGRFEDEGWRLRRDGTQFWANVIVTPQYGHDGAPTGFCKITRDLTERKRLERELQEQKALFQTILECIGDAIIAADTDGRFLLWNPAAERLIGMGPTSGSADSWPTVYGCFLPDRTTPFPAHELPLVRAIHGEETNDVRLFIRNAKIPEGVWTSDSARPLRDAQGQVRGGVVVMRDVSEQVRADALIRTLNADLEKRVLERTAELAEANRELHQKNQENELFVYSVSHDLRSPLVNLEGFSKELSMICGDLRGLLHGKGVPDTVRERGLELVDRDMAESVRFIQNAVKRLSNIIDALLRLSRAGRVEYQWQHVQLGSILERIVSAMRKTTDDLGATVTIHDVPALRGDPGALEQVFANLIGNALNYLDPNRPGQVEVGALPTEGAFVVAFVKDNGVGIPAAFQHKIFQAFQRLQPDQTAGEGMGLTIVKRIVERHRGRIWVESEAGGGATFYVALPVSTVASAPPTNNR